MLTPQMRTALVVIEKCVQERGITPTLQEIADGMGCASKANAHRVVDQLVERGYVRRLPNKARGIEIIRQAPSLGVPVTDDMVERAFRSLLGRPFNSRTMREALEAALNPPQHTGKPKEPR